MSALVFLAGIIALVNPEIRVLVIGLQSSAQGAIMNELVARGHNVSLALPIIATPPTLHGVKIIRFNAWKSDNDFQSAFSMRADLRAPRFREST